MLWNYVMLQAFTEMRETQKQNHWTKAFPEVLMCHSEFLEYKGIGISFVLSVLKYFHLNADFDFPSGTR